MRLLVIGGTVFVGRAAVAAALARGHAVTIFHRASTTRTCSRRPSACSGPQRDLSALHGRDRDAVIDTCGFEPEHVAATPGCWRSGRPLRLRLLRVGLPRLGRTLVTEESPVFEGEEREYGPLKAACERAAEAAMPGRVLAARAGVIVGPHEDIGRLPRWLWRCAEGGEVLAPGPPAAPIQLIDARDLAAWMLDMAEPARAGTYNATAEPGSATWGELLEAVRAATGGRAELRWADPPGSRSGSRSRGTSCRCGRSRRSPASTRCRASRRRRGLAPRPLAATVADTWAWLSRAARSTTGARRCARAALGEAERAARRPAQLKHDHAQSTSAPPASWSGPSVSPNTIHASATVNGGSIVEAIDAVEGPTRASPAMNSTIGMTVETEAMIAAHITPSPDALMPPSSSAAMPKVRAEPVATLAANGTGGECVGHGVGGEDEDRVEERGADRHRGAHEVDRAGAAAEQDERDAARGEAERAELAAAGRLAAQRDRGHGDERRVGVEQQRGEPGVDALERAEVEAGLDGVAEEAERDAGGEAAQRAERPAPQRDQRPQHGRGHREAQRQQRGDPQAGRVGLLGEDRHRAEAGGRHQTQKEPLSLSSHAQAEGAPGWCV